MTRAMLGGAIILAVLGGGASAQEFVFSPAGELIAGSGRGATDPTLYSPAMRFPVEKRPAFANSQVWMKGGSRGAPGSWRDASNFRYPWRDNFCEARSRRTPSCPSGTGHQGQDIRAGDGADDRYWAVATEDGRISNIGVYSVELTGTSGTRYRYLHLSMNNLRVAQNSAVRAGDRIGLISADFGGVPTPVHLHFEMLQNVGGNGFRQVPPYMSLVRSYERLTGQP